MVRNITEYFYVVLFIATGKKESNDKGSNAGGIAAGVIVSLVIVLAVIFASVAVYFWM